MANEIELCISSKACSTLPCEASAHLSKSAADAIFLQDNPHISNNIIPQGTPYILRQGQTEQARPWQQLRPDLANSFNQLKSLPAQARRNIAALNDTYGSDLLLALSEFHHGEIAPMLASAKQYQQETVIPFLKSDSHGLAGAAATAMESRLSGFAKAANKYQQALEKLQQAVKAKAPKIQLIKLEQTARTLHQNLNVKFQAELNKYMGIAKAKGRGTPWSNADRGVNLAKSNSNAKPIKLNSTTAFNTIKNFEKAANIGGKLAIMIDAGMRVNSVQNDYTAGNNWQRSAVMETTGFGLGTAAGAFVGAKIITSAMGIAMMATPVGWVFIIGVGLAAGYAAAKAGDGIGKWLSGLIYDSSASLSSL